MSTLLVEDSFTPYGEQILIDKADLDVLPISKIQIFQPIKNTMSMAST